MGPYREAGEFYPTPPTSSKGFLVRRLGRQALHLLDYVLCPQQAALASEELHGLEEACADGTAGDGEAQWMNKVACTLLLLGSEAAHSFFYCCVGPLGERGEALDELREVLANELPAELLLELGFVVAERAAVEV